MLFRTLCCSGIVFAVAVTGALSSDYSAAQPGRSSIESGVYRHHRNGLRLPKELKMMWRQEERPHLKAMPKNQRRGWLRAKWLGMTDQQKQVKLAELQSKWNALPASVRDNLLERKRQKREAKLMQRSGRGSQSTQPSQH
jgi:hypothetical protein